MLTKNKLLLAPGDRMKDKLSIEDIECCPLCKCDEFLISNSGSMLCAQCGSFFESVHLVVAVEHYQTNVESLIPNLQPSLIH